MLICTKNKHKSLEGTGESLCLKIRDNDLALVRIQNILVFRLTIVLIGKSTLEVSLSRYLEQLVS